MGSIGSEVEAGSHPIISYCKKCNSLEEPLHDCGAVDYALVPRKPRTSVKKRARANIVLPWSTSRSVSDGTGRPRFKELRLIMNKGEISKDEEEVAETLNSLAQQFSNTANTNKPELDAESSAVKSSIEDSTILNARDGAEKGNTSSIVLHPFFADKYPQILAEPKKIRKGGAGHVRIAHLIKAMQRSEMLRGLAPRPPQLTIGRGLAQMRGNYGQQSLMLPSFRAGPSLEGLQQFRALHPQLRAYPNMASPFVLHGRTSAETALQARLGSSTSMLPQRWPGHGGVAAPQTRGRYDSTSFFSDSRARYPYMYLPIGPQLQRPPPQPQYMLPFGNPSSSMGGQYHHLNLRPFDRNGGFR